MAARKKNQNKLVAPINPGKNDIGNLIFIQNFPIQI